MLLLCLCVAALLAAAASAAGTPDISASASSSSPLYGEPVHVTLDGANPGGQPYGYNLSYRVVLPKGVSYQGGSPVPPTVVEDQPANEETTLIFSNVADLSPSSHKELGFDLGYDQATWHAGDVIPVRAQAFINTDPRFVPKFSPAGQPEGPSATSYTGFSAEVVGEQKLKAIKVTAEEPSPEGEILRGVHEDQTVYTLKVRNNGINPTTGTKLDAYVPAGLEYLGCGAPGGAGTDNTHEAIATDPGSAEEYPGSGPIKVETLAECQAPELVETEELDPDGAGPTPFGVYTHVRWDVGTLAATQVKTFKYRAAVPIRGNALAFTGGAKPSGASGQQAANLDNNTGPEVLDEASLPTFATASGTYQGGAPQPTSDETVLDRTAEDWVVHKGVEASRLEQGQNVKWTLTFETSEYKYVKDGVVTDTLPNGLCPLGPTNFTHEPRDPADAECDPVSGKEPTAAYSSAIENADGSWTLTWNAAQFTPAQHTGINDKFTLSFWTHTRTHYQDNFEPTTPILSRDKLTNAVTTEADGFARCIAPEATNCENPAAKISHEVPDGTRIVDGSSALLEAESPTLEKFVSSGSADCATAIYVKAPTVPVYHPGDKVCWKLRIAFPGTLDTDAQTIADFLPPGSKYLAGSDEPHGENNVEATIDESSAAAGVITWTAKNATVPAGGQVFERVIATEVAPVGNVVDGDLKGNLLKFSSANTPGESEALRAEANYEITAPVLALTKGVNKIDGTPAGGRKADEDGGTVREESTVEYRIDVSNEGGAAAKTTVIRDDLEDGITCADVKSVSHLGGCSSNHVEWVYEPDIGPGETETFFYAVEIPAGVEAGKRFDDHAGIVSYQSETNATPTPGLFTYVPAENIAGGGAGTPNVPAADDTSFVETPGIAFTKTRTTAVGEAGNNVASQATIGEAITYTSKLIVPEGTTLTDAHFLDVLGSERFAELINAETVVNGVPGAPSGGSETVGSADLSLEVDFPSAYHNPAGSGDDLIEFIITARVKDSAANSRVAPKQTLTNTAHLSWEEGGTTPKETTASVDTEIVEPNLGIAKSDDDADNRVSPGQVVQYTLTTSNLAGSRVSMAHDVEVEDHVPAGLIPVGEGPGNVPLTEGAEIPGSGGAVWHASSRTITKKVATIEPGKNTSFSYRAEVENPAVAGSTLTNEVEASAASLAEGSSPIRRTSGSGYEAKAEDTVRLIGASIEKSSTPATATPGDPITYHLKVTIPASVNLFDTTVRDVLPAGVEFDGYGSEECLSGCPLVNPVHEYREAVNGNGTETIAWDLGDIPALSQPQVVEFTYSGHLRATNRVVGGNVVKANTEVNAATVGSDLTDKTGPFDENEIPSSFDETSAEAKTTTTVIEPQLALDKQIEVGSGGFGDGPVTAHSNDPLAYRLIVENEGNSPAYDAEVTDQLDPALTNVNVVSQPGVSVVTPWSEGTHAMSLAIAGPIPVGGSVTIEYTASFVAPSALHDGQQVVNAAALPKYFGVPAAERAANPSWEFRQYAGGSDSTEAVLDFPSFTLTKTTGLSGNPDSGNAEINQEFPWRIVAANTSATAGAANVTVTDTLPPNWSYVPGSSKVDGTTVADPAGSGATLEWTLASLPAASSKTITFAAKPALAAATTPGTGPEANVNTAQITGASDEAGNSGNAEGPYGSAPDSAKATLLLPDLELEKTPDNGAAVAGSPSSFTVKVTNSGPGAARNLDVEDGTSAGLAYTAGTATANPATGFSETSVNSGPAPGETTVHWHLDSLASGASVTITMPVTVGAGVADGTTLTNVAEVTSDEVTTPVGDDGSLLVGAEADMAIEKTGAATYTPGGEYTWHLKVRNLGPSDAQGVEVGDPLPAGTTFVSASAPCSLSGGEVECVIGTAPTGFEATYDVTVEVDPGAVASPLSNTATVSSPTDTNPGNDTSTFGPAPSPLADVWVRKTAAPELILKSQESEFTIEVGNDGPSTARSVKLTDPLPGEGLEFVSADSPCTQAAGTVSCEFGDLEPGTTETVHVKAKGVKDGVWVNTATISTTTPEPPGPAAEENNHSSAEVGVGPVVDLAIVKTGPATVDAGGQLTWTLEVTNNGPDDATGVKVDDTLPAGVQFVSADPGCAAAAGIVSCALGELAVGDSAVRHVTVTVPPALGDQTLLNSASVAGDQGELERENNHSEARTTVGPAADLAITKTGPARVAADGDVSWTLVATNNGPSTATGVTVDDTLPGGVSLSSANPSQGSCSGSLGCSLGTLARGASAQIQVVAHVPASLQGTTLTNRAKIGGDQPDPNPGNNEASASTQVDPPAANAATFDLTLVKKLVGPSRPQLGDVLTYNLTVANAGPATAKAVKITDALPSGLEYVAAKVAGGKCAAKGSVVTCRLASLAAGAKRSATLKARATESGAIRNTASVGAEVADQKPADDRDSAVADIRAGSASLYLVKKRLGHGKVEAGDAVRFRIRVSNRGVGGAEDVVVCDRLPGAMSFVAVKAAKFLNGEACWTIAMLAPGGSRSFAVVTQVDGGTGAGTVRNVATAEADNAPSRSAAAPVRVKASGPGREGGVTG
jgi:uncharacterized repeat protein (TIGR01451 family)